MAGVGITLTLMCGFFAVLWVLWLRAQPLGASGLPPEDQAPRGASHRLPRGSRGQDRYIRRGLEELESWVRRQARHPDAGT